MEKHDHVVRNLNEEFKKVDREYNTSGMRVFGQNTANIFRELDVIRRKQIDLASGHVSLDPIQDIPAANLSKLSVNNKSNQDVSSAKSFERKETMLKTMMEKLDDITQSMSRFKKIVENGHDGENTLVQLDDEAAEESAHQDPDPSSSLLHN